MRVPDPSIGAWTPGSTEPEATIGVYEAEDDSGRTMLRSEDPRGYGVAIVLNDEGVAWLIDKLEARLRAKRASTRTGSLVITYEWRPDE